MKRVCKEAHYFWQHNMMCISVWVLWWFLGK